MAVETFSLPKNPRDLALAVNRHANRCMSMYMARRTSWLLAWYYFNGYRRFDVFNPSTGEITPHFLDEEGNMEYQSQELLFSINQIAGRIQSMDARMKAESQAFSLAALRERAVAQVVGDSVINEQTLRPVLDEFSWIYSALGMCGLTGHLVDHPTIGLTADLEVIHPKELFPFPIVAEDFTKARGIMRQRWVPVDYLKEIYGNKVTRNLDKMEWYEGDFGERWDHHSDQYPGITYWANRGGAANESPQGNAEGIGVARIRELWLNGVNGTVTRYACTSGEYTLQDQDLSDSETYCPIGWARFFNNGTWYGAGMFDLMFSVHRQLELLSKSLFNNVRDIDRYGVLVLPQGQINQNQLLRDVGRGLRVMFWEPDAVAEGFKPFPIQPFNSGEMPGRVAQFARESMRSINPIQDLVKEKGRVDSASGLQFLDEQINKAITSPTQGVQKCFGDAYRSIIQRSVRQLAVSPRPLPVTNLTLDLAGAIIDPKTLEVSFPRNPLPRIGGLRFSLREISPRSQVARKQEAVQLWQLGIEKDELNFRLFALKEALDFALWQEEDKGAYEMAILTVLMLFGDGEENNQVVLTPHTTRPEIVLKVVNAFMEGPILQRASDKIIDDFKELRLTLLQFMGLTLPNAVPNPDDAAMLALSGGMGGGPPQMGGGSPMMGQPMAGLPGR